MINEEKLRFQTIELRARFLANALLRKKYGDERNRNVDQDIEVALDALLEILRDQDGDS